MKMTLFGLQYKEFPLTVFGPLEPYVDVIFCLFLINKFLHVMVSFFLSSLSQTGNKLEWGFVRAFNTNKQMQGLSLFRFVSFTVDQMFLRRTNNYSCYILCKSCDK